MSRICWASSRGSFRFDQMSVHPSVPALADITHNAIHDDRINVTAGRCLTPDSPSRRAGIADGSALFESAGVGAVADLVRLAGDKALDEVRVGIRDGRRCAIERISSCHELVPQVRIRAVLVFPAP
jgi:hypothetical protein